MTSLRKFLELKKKTRRWLTAVGVMIGAGGLVMWLGLIPVPASSGHSAPVAWLLHFAMQRSVDTWSNRAQAPDDLDNPARVLQGAGHYVTGCAACHGAPGEPRSEIALQMTPVPPRLEPWIDEWQDKELFYIVLHGLKYTGMPAWPARHREDEVWSMVAFLRRLPVLDETGYRRLAYGEVEAFESGVAALEEPLAAVQANCARCHGANGEGRGNAFPRLDIQEPAYLAASLEAYALGLRASGFMESQAQGLEPRQIERLARHFAGRGGDTPGGPAPRPSSPSNELGQRIAQQGIPEQRVPACRFCHGPEPVADHPLFPRLAGQPADYLAAQLRLFKARHRGGTPYSVIMTQIAQGLDEREIAAVAAYYGRTSPD